MVKQKVYVIELKYTTSELAAANVIIKPSQLTLNIQQLSVSSNQ